VKVADIPADKIVMLAEKHITLYKNRIESGSRYILVQECEQYLKTWESIKKKQGVYADLVQAEKTEVMDAAYSGSFDGLLGITHDDLDDCGEDDDEHIDG
jgi:hypothetical protein